jgi:hypothetical protein
MFAMVLGWLGNLLGGPFAKAAVAAYSAKLTAENSTEKTAAGLAAQELSLQQRVAIYFGKLLIFDKVLALGVTDPLGGFAATTANLVVMFYFGKRAFENVARIIKR